MRFLLSAVALLLLTLAPPASAKPPKPLTDAAIAQRLIDASIADYPGNCPCPYHTDRAGRRCGRRSAWSRPGGHAPLCYRSDVTQSMIETYRRQHR